MASPSTSSKDTQNNNPLTESEIREQHMDTATAVLSLTGPCRGVGDVYLACVATAGLGQCRHLRASFEQCVKSTKEGSRRYLQGIGEQMFPDEQDGILSAAKIINQRLFENAASPLNENLEE